MSMSKDAGSGTPSSLRDLMDLALSKRLSFSSMPCSYLFYFLNMNSICICNISFFRMPDPDFSVNDVKLFVGKCFSG